jgi:Flp pilus assembly protein TadD
MKSLSQWSCLLFALAIAACGEKSSTPAATPAGSAAQDSVVRSAPVAEPVVSEGPKVPVSPVAPVASVPAEIPATFAEQLKLGATLAAKGDHARARVMFEAAAKADRKAAMPHVELARSYIATRHKAHAIRHASKAVKLAPGSSLAYNTLGRAELLRHDYDAAIIAFRQATEIDPGNVWAWNNLGLVYLTLEDHLEAANALVEATTRKGAEGYMWNNLGLAYEHLDQLDDARAAFEAGAKLGSVAAKASRKRLEGVDTIVIAKQPATREQTYDLREPMPELDAPEAEVVEPAPEVEVEIEADEVPDEDPRDPMTL